jgi:AcrR family transcriptional regulator
MIDRDEDTGGRRRDRFHHGDLREALIQATHELLVEHGPESFTLADACRRAGVSTAAPYKHFRDKQEILEEIAARGFEELARRAAAAVAEHGPGTQAGIAAMGRAYVAFALDQSATFRLMFGHNAALKKAERVDRSAMCCFENVIREVTTYCENHGLAADAHRIAVRLWTFVHGAASLSIDGDYEAISPDLDVDAMIADATPRLLHG